MSLKIINNPRLNFAVVNGDSDITKEGNVCLASCSDDLLLSTNLDCKNYSMDLSTSWTAGADPSVASNFDSASDFHLVSYSVNDSSDLTLSSVLAKIAFKKCGDFNVRVGCAYNSKWYDGDVRTYLGDGASFNKYPLLFNPLATGMELKYSNKHVTCYGSLKNDSTKSLEINSNENGFLGNKTPLYSDVGIIYRNNNVVSPFLLNMNCQRFDKREGDGTVDFASGYTSSSKTAIDDTITREGSINALTAVCATNFEGFEINGALTCANTKPIDTADSQTEGRVLKWSVGCVTKCKEIDCIPGGLGKVDAYGMVVSTPAYLQEKNGTTDSDPIPLACEGYILASFCGINVPIALTYMNNKENGVEGDIKGSACVLSIRPNLMTEYSLGGKVIQKVKCEGSIELEDEDEE